MSLLFLAPLTRSVPTGVHLVPSLESINSKVELEKAIAALDAALFDA
jgi:hypothetical protein